VQGGVYSQSAMAGPHIPVAGNAYPPPLYPPNANVTPPPYPELPPGWEQRVDGEGRPYFQNAISKQTQWERPSLYPPNANVTPPPYPELPPGWEQRVDGEGRPYFQNAISKQTQWERPSF